MSGTQATPPFERTLYAGWADLDANAHMRNTAFLDKAVDLRMMFFAEHGVPAAEFARLRVGPVVMRDEIDYRGEVRLLEALRVTLAAAGMSEDGTRFQLRNEIFRADGRLAARLLTTGGWLDLDRRRLIVPPEPVFAAMRALPRIADFAALPSSLRSGGAAA